MEKEDGKQAVKRFYSTKRNETVKERIRSDVIGVRVTNNFIKAMLVRKYVQDNDRVLDIGGGRGGDLLKYDTANVGAVVLTDICEQSLAVARERYESLHLSFPFKTVCADICDPDIEYGGPFDVVACQFMIHYVFESEEHAAVAFQKIGEALRPGGVAMFTFPSPREVVRRIGGVRSTYRTGNLEMTRLSDWDAADPYGWRYSFTLRDCVDRCPEYVVDPREFRRLCKVNHLVIDVEMPFADALVEGMYWHPWIADMMHVAPTREDMEIVSLYEYIACTKSEA